MNKWLISAKDILTRFPSILNTVFFQDDFYIIAEMKVWIDKKKIWIYKNWKEEITLLDEIIKFKKYLYNWLPSLVVWRDWEEYFIINNTRMLWPFRREIRTAELLSSWWLYVVQKNENWKENIFLNNNIVLNDVEEADICSDRISSDFVIIKYKKDNTYIVQLNWTEMIKTDKKIQKIWFESWNIPYVLYSDDTMEYIDSPDIDWLI